MIQITHIHPMLVHFPIVLFLVAFLLFVYAQIKKEDLVSRNCLSITANSALILATVFAIGAAIFGDIALDAALDKGFPKGPLEEHETLAGVTITIFSILSLVMIVSLWKRISMAGARGWGFLGVAFVGLVMLISTAYHGGELVYKHGVNVEEISIDKSKAAGPG